MSKLAQILVAFAALLGLWILLGWVLKLVAGVVSLAITLFWLAVIVAAAVFLIGLVRRLLRI